MLVNEMDREDTRQQANRFHRIDDGCVTRAFKDDYDTAAVIGSVHFGELRVTNGTGDSLAGLGTGVNDATCDVDFAFHVRASSHTAIAFTGQDGTQSPHPVQRSGSTMGRATRPMVGLKRMASASHASRQS